MMRARLFEVVRQFRLGMYGGASHMLTDLIDSLVAAIAGPLQAHTPALLPVLKEILPAMERADYLRVADLLEYELDPILRDAGLAADS